MTEDVDLSRAKLATRLACVPIFGKYLSPGRSHEIDDQPPEPVNKVL